MESSVYSKSSETGDKIVGQARFAVLEDLKNDRTVLQLSVIGKNYERLSLVSGIEHKNDTTYVLLDCPADFTETITDYSGTALRLEFVGKDKVQYTFGTRILAISGQNIRIEFPEFIARIQRRIYFRLAPPIGTIAVFSKDGKPLEASVINLSEGGALLSLPPSISKELVFAPGSNLDNLRLRWDVEHSRMEIAVRKAVVKRAERHPETGRFVFAVQFVSLEKRDSNMIDEYIFRWQREAFRKRSLIGDS